MTKRYFYLIFLLCSIFVDVAGQLPFPPKGIVFADDAVNRIDVFLETDSIDALLEPGNEYSNHEYPATFILTYNNTADTIENVGFRLRGNTSRVSGKKSFKISFNTFTGNNYYGLEKMNINGEHNDPSIARSKICWDICRDFEVIGSRCNPVELYINSEYKGLYVNVEHVDEEFIELRFGNKDGNLYKCLWPADLVYKGSNPDLYKEVLYGRRTYDLKTNTNTDDYSDLANFIDILNNSTLSNLPYDLEEVFNVPGFLRYLAIEIYTGHWDGYAYNKNNYYLYNDPETGMFHFLPYDLDNTLGIDWIGRDWATRDINDWASHGGYRPLVERLMDVSEYKDWFNFYVNKLIDERTNTNIIFPEIDAYRDMVKDYVVYDNYHSLDYGYSYNDFINSYINSQGGHVTYGVKPYFTTRVSSANQQLDLNNINPIISNVRNNHPGAQQLVNITAKAEDEYQLVVRLFYSDDQTNWNSETMLDDGFNNDGQANDETFGINIGPFAAGSQIDYYIEAEDNSGNISRYPRSGSKYILIENLSPVTLVINEFMAKNSNVISDQNGNFDDWIEILNIGNSPVYLGDKFLSDKLNSQTKWQLPAVTLGAGEYYLIWADKEENEGINHTNFKLSSKGEEIVLTDADGISIIDYVKYYWQTENLSEGRYPNGNGPVQYLGFPTPGYTNELMDIENHQPSVNIQVYPNPFIDHCTIEIQDSENQQKLLQVFSVDGKLLFTKSFHEEIYFWSGNNNNIKSGIYFLRIDLNRKIIATQRIVKL
ncbi:MAG: CotH kinase family protein [Bacteroidota bacterium]|nr:CotH kinase family protein [Bacteroidota bacterium]